MTANPNLNASEMLKAFVEAGNALEQLPKVQADLEAAMSLADETNSKLSAEQALTASLKARIAELEAAKSEVEAKFADATFRHDSVQKVLDLIRGALPVQPASPEHVQPVSQAQANPEAPQSPLNPEPSETSTFADADQSPNPSAEPRWIVEASTASPSSPENSPALDTAPTSTPQPASGDDGLDYQGQNAPRPTEDREPAKPYWLKPNSLSWRDWSNSGGEVAPWVGDLASA